MRFAPLLPLALLAGCGGTKATQESDAPKPIAQVHTAIARIGLSSNDVTVYGATEAGPGAERTVIAPAEAILVSVSAPTGTSVAAGQPVVVLRPSRATRLEITKATSDATVAQAAYQRALRLKADGLVSNADVDTARAAVTTASATRNNLGLGAGGMTLRAPVSGTVQGLTAKPGDQIASGATLATIAGKGDLRARFGVDPQIAQRIHPGQSLTVATLAGGGRTVVPVVGVDPQVDPATRLATVFVRIPPGVGLGAGAPLKAMITVGDTANGITIPYAALLDDGGRSYVFVVHNGIAKRVEVSPGNSSGDQVQILKGLQPGDRVVTVGGTALEDGIAVHERRTPA